MLHVLTIVKPTVPAFEPLKLDDVPAAVWRTSCLVRFGHCDPAGIVYTPEYFNIFNGVIEDWYTDALRISYYDLIGPRRVGLGYAHTSADFAVPSRMGDVLDVAVVVAAIGRASLSLRLHAFKDRRECVRASFVTVATSLDTHKPMPLPDDLRTAFEGYQALCREMPGGA